MSFELFDYQLDALGQLKTGSILCGGVGSGKSITSLAYFYLSICGGKIEKKEIVSWANPKNLYIITTVKKRDGLDWLKEDRLLTSKLDKGTYEIVVDSWNNIKKYATITDSFFIFDEQRLVGSGAWVKSFLKISKKNQWILLSATPGDTWSDYIPVFIANGFYKSRNDFIIKHVVYNSFTKFPKIDRYVDTGILFRFRDQITVNMKYEKKTISHFLIKEVPYDKKVFDKAYINRWNPFENRPIRDVSEYCYTLRRIVNSDPGRLAAIRTIISQFKKLIIFYNFDYELEILKSLKDISDLRIAEYNGHAHEEIPDSESWIYLVQYTAGSEGWNCIETNVIIFYSQNYSYRTMVQAAGRIDRLNTPFVNLYYYTLVSSSEIDKAIRKTILLKKVFNEMRFSNF